MARPDGVGSTGVSAQQYQQFIDSHKTGVKAKKGFNFRSAVAAKGKAFIKAGRERLKPGGAKHSPLRSKSIAAVPKELVTPKLPRPQTPPNRATQTAAPAPQPSHSSQAVRTATPSAKDDFEAFLDGVELDDDMMNQLEQEVRAEGFGYRSKAAAPVRPQGNRKKAVDNEPENLKRLRMENEQRRKKMEHDIANLPSPPTTRPKGSQQSNKLMSPQSKAMTLPSGYRALSQYISGITTAKDLLETWNTLTTLALRGDISGSQMSQLKDHCVGMLERVSQNPAEADQITEVHLKKMIPNIVDRMKISAKISLNQSEFVDLRNRLDNNRRG